MFILLVGEWDKIPFSCVRGEIVMIINNVSSQDIAKTTSATCGKIKEKEYRDNLENEDFNAKYAATMEISKEGYKKAQKLIEQTDIPKGATEMSCNNCKTLQNLLDTVKNGGSLSEEEKERICMEIQHEIEIQYQSMLKLRLEEDDERVLNELKEDYLLKQRALVQMQEKIQEEKIKEETKELQEKSTENANHIINKMSEIEMLNQSLNISTSDEKINEKQDTKQNVKEKNKEGIHPLQNAIISVEEKEETVKELENRQILAAKAEKEYEKLLTQEYEETKSIFGDEENSLYDKVIAYEQFKEKSAELGVKREVERHRKMFYYEARLEAKNELLSNQEIATAQNNIDESLELQKEMLVDGIGQKFIRDKLKENILNYI